MACLSRRSPFRSKIRGMETTGLIEIRTEYGATRLQRGDDTADWLFSFGAEARYIQVVEGLELASTLLLDGSRSGTVESVEVLALPEIHNSVPEPHVGVGDRVPIGHKAEARFVTGVGEVWVSGQVLCQQRDLIEFETVGAERLWLSPVDVRA